MANSCVFMFLKTSSKLMPGQRRHTRHALGLNLKIKSPKLKIGFKHTAGRGLSGVKTVLSKAHRKYNSTYVQMYPVSGGIFSLTMAVHLFPWTKNCKVAMMLKTAAGLWYATPVHLGMRPLSYLQSVPGHEESKQILRPSVAWWQMVARMHSYTRVSNVGDHVGALPKYARAAGSTVTLLIPQLTPHFALTSLPSGQLKLLSNRMYVNHGGLQPTDWKFFTNTKAGYWKNLGYATTVRGTVKNPNDHPHGGRTRAIKYPRTPWGKTAKKSRKPRLHIKLKALRKREKGLYSKQTPYWAHA